MKLFDVLKIKHPEITTQNTKIHLAVWNGKENPLDVFFAGQFESWQSWQSKRNFQRKHIVSLIQIPGNNRWIFAGAFTSNDSKFIEEKNYHLYDTTEISDLKEFSGRLVVSFKRSGRQSYLVAENWAKEMIVNEFFAEKMVVSDFDGYKKSLISKSKLDIITSQEIPSWKSALNNVSGVYLITDRKTGMLYVGSATGEEGIWQRWLQYSHNGHGGNKELMKIIKDKGFDYSNNFQYSILEIADTHTSNKEILDRESYWKDVLCSREFGYNGN